MTTGMFKSPTRRKGPKGMSDTTPQINSRNTSKINKYPKTTANHAE